MMRIYKTISALVLCVVLSGLLLTPKPAQASCPRWCCNLICPGDMVIDIMKKSLKTILKGLKAITNALLMEQWLSFQTSFENLGFFKGEAATAQLKQDQLTANDAATKAFQVAQLTIAANIAAASPSTPGADRVLCENIKVKKKAEGMRLYARSVSDFLSKGLLRAGRGRGTDSNGPGYIRKDFGMMCGINPGDPKTGNSLDGVDPSCVATAEFVNLNMSKRVLTPGFSVLQMPSTDSGVLKAQNTKQQRWIAASDYCGRVIGPHPPSPRGKELETPSGKARMVNFSKCMARMSPYVQTCTDAVGALTRPNCADPETKIYCDEAKTMCDAAKVVGVIIPPEFGDCDEGLSAYETEKLVIMMCRGGNVYFEGKVASATSDELSKQEKLCSALELAWQKKQQLNADMLASSLKSLQEMRSCWLDVRE